MDQGRERAVGAVTRAAELAPDADNARRRQEDARKREHADRDDEFAQVKQALTDTENADTSKDRDLDGQRVSEIKSLLAEGGDQAVAKKFGEAALSSPEAAKAKTQRAAIRKHERDLALSAMSDTAADRGEQTARAKQQSQTPLRDQAIERQLQRERDRGRGEQQLTAPPDKQPSLTPRRDEAVARLLQRERDTQRGR